jgi:hypothetical protein
MVDGVPKLVGVWTHPLLDLLSVDLAQQVDVYKGAQPVLVGNMAFATVDLVSRRRATPGLGLRLTAAYGGFDTSAFTLLQEGRTGRFDWLVSASHLQSDGAATATRRDSSSSTSTTARSTGSSGTRRRPRASPP